MQVCTNVPLSPSEEVPRISCETVNSVMLANQNEKGDNWLQVPIKEHLEHAFIHLVKHLGGDTSETHLENAATRIAMALALKRREGKR